MIDSPVSSIPNRVSSEQTQPVLSTVETTEPSTPEYDYWRNPKFDLHYVGSDISFLRDNLQTAELWICPDKCDSPNSTGLQRIMGKIVEDESFVRKAVFEIPEEHALRWDQIEVSVYKTFLDGEQRIWAQIYAISTKFGNKGCVRSFRAKQTWSKYHDGQTMTTWEIPERVTGVTGCEDEYLPKHFRNPPE